MHLLHSQPGSKTHHSQIVSTNTDPALFQSLRQSSNLESAAKMNGALISVQSVTKLVILFDFGVILRDFVLITVVISPSAVRVK